MKKNFKLLLLCFFTLPVFSEPLKTIVHDEDVAISVDFPRGNVLVWIALLEQNLKEQVPDKKILIDVHVGFPNIKIGNKVNNVQMIKTIQTNMLEQFITGLLPNMKNSGVGVIHPSLKVRHMPCKQIVKIIEDCFGCHADYTSNKISFSLYPELLEIYEYRRSTKMSPDVWEIINTVYFEGSTAAKDCFIFLPQGQNDESAFVVATPEIHKRALKQLAQLRGRFSCPEVSPFVPCLPEKQTKNQ